MEIPVILGRDAQSYFDTKTVSELKVTLDNIWDNFLQIQLTKLSGVLEIV